MPTDGCNNVFCDTPFGTQYVNVDAEYSDRIFEKCIAHRKRKGVIVAKNFIQSKLNEKNVSILKGNSDRYFQCDVELKNLGIILLNSIERIESLWERDINDDIEAKGKHKLTYSVCFEDCAKENVDKFLENVFFSDLSRENPNYSTLLPPFYSFFDIKGNGIDVTSFREKNSGDYLRVVETIGKGQTIYFSKNNYISCEAQRLSGESISLLIEKENYFSYELKPYEIVTFLLKKK